MLPQTQSNIWMIESACVFPGKCIKDATLTMLGTGCMHLILKNPSHNQVATSAAQSFAT